MLWMKNEFVERFKRVVCVYKYQKNILKSQTPYLDWLKRAKFNNFCEVIKRFLNRMGKTVNGKRKPWS